MLVRYPDILVAVVAAALLLALTSASAALFLSSAETAAFERTTATTPSVLAGLTVGQFGPGVTNGDLEQITRARDDALTPAVSSLDGLRPRILTLIGVQPDLLNPGPGDDQRGRLVARSGAIDNIEVVAAGDGPGVWISSTSADALDLGPGDFVTLTYNGRSVETPIAGTYRPLAGSPPTDYWQSIRRYIYPEPGADSAPAPFIIADQDLYFELESALGDQRPLAQWEWPIDKRNMSLSDAAALSDGIGRIEQQLDTVDSATGSVARFSEFQFPNHFTILPDLVQTARETVDGISLPVRLLSNAGIGVSLVMIAAAGMFGIRRRRVEAALLSARGVGSFAFGIKAALEVLIPVGVGTALGYFAALPLVSWLGPSAVIEGDARSTALQFVIASALVAIAVIGVVSAISGRRQAEMASMRTVSVASLPWEAPVLLLAAGAYLLIRTRDIAPAETGGEAGHVDLLLLLFPILFVAGGAGLARRLGQRLLPRLGAIGDDLPPAAYLASRRLRAAHGLALALVVAASIAIGVFTYAGTLVASVDATATAKAQVAVGSDVSAVFSLGAEMPADLPFPATELQRIDNLNLVPSNRQVTALAVDPETFGEASFWDASFADRPLDELLDAIGSPSEEQLPAVIIGTSERVESLELFTTTLPLRIVEYAEAWPGMNTNEPTVVVSRSALDAALEATGGSLGGASISHEMLAKGSEDAVVTAMEARNVDLSFVGTAERARTTPALLAASWTFSYLQAIGIGAGLVVLVGLVLYLQSRQRAGIISFALARRMGLTGASYRLSIVFEVAVMLIAALATGVVLALVAVALVYKRFDVLPSLPPDPLLRIPATMLAAAAGVLLVAAVIGGWRSLQTARRANIAEVLRLAE